MPLVAVYDTKPYDRDYLGPAAKAAAAMSNCAVAVSFHVTGKGEGSFGADLASLPDSCI